MNSKNGFFIGELAKQAQVTVDTIRYYEKIGLLPKPRRLTSSYRIYSPEVLERIRFIKQAQLLNFSLEEIATLLQLQHNDRAACLSVHDLLKQKLQQVDRHLSELQNFRQTLLTNLAECNNTLSHSEESPCPVLEELPQQPVTSFVQIPPTRKNKKA
jgi:DNA-binding transcriptional MerR regulator